MPIFNRHFRRCCHHCRHRRHSHSHRLRRSNVFSRCVISFSFDMPFFPAFTGLFFCVWAHERTNKLAHTLNIAHIAFKRFVCRLDITIQLMQNYCFPYLFIDYNNNIAKKKKKKEKNEKNKKKKPMKEEKKPLVDQSNLLSSNLEFAFAKHLHTITYLHFSSVIFPFHLAFNLFIYVQC